MANYPYIKDTTVNHSNLVGLNNDDHQQYLNLNGRSGGQIINGGVDSSDNLEINATSNTVNNGTVFINKDNNVVVGNVLSFSDIPGVSIPTLRRCTIDSNTGDITSTTTGPDLMLNSNSTITPDQQFKALKIWSAVYNDIVDFQELTDSNSVIYFGKCYYQTIKGLDVCNKYCQKGVVGVASDTFGLSVGKDRNITQVPIAISGWVLAHVDKIYQPGTPLTNDKDGILTKIDMFHKIFYPERIVGIYYRPEYNEFWGPPNKKIRVNNRHWIKVL